MVAPPRPPTVPAAAGRLRLDRRVTTLSGGSAAARRPSRGSHDHVRRARDLRRDLERGSRWLACTSSIYGLDGGQVVSCARPSPPSPRAECSPPDLTQPSPGSRASRPIPTDRGSACSTEPRPHCPIKCFERSCELRAGRERRELGATARSDKFVGLLRRCGEEWASRRALQRPARPTRAIAPRARVYRAASNVILP